MKMWGFRQTINVGWLNMLGVRWTFQHVENWALAKRYQTFIQHVRMFSIWWRGNIVEAFLAVFLCLTSLTEEIENGGWKRGKTGGWIRRRQESDYFYNIVLGELTVKDTSAYHCGISRNGRRYFPSPICFTLLPSCSPPFSNERTNAVVMETTQCAVTMRVRASNMFVEAGQTNKLLHIQNMNKRNV